MASLIYYTPSLPAIGSLLIQADDLGITSLTLASSVSASSTPSTSCSVSAPSSFSLSGSSPFLPDTPQATRHLEDAVAWLDEYFAGRVPKAFPAFHLSGTPFQIRVWEALQAIPYGTVTTYGAIARLFGERMSAQAVGQSVGRNPVAIIIPCHRVVGAGGIGGYAYGLPMKRALLALEGLL